MKIKHTFAAVLINGDDQVIVRDLLIKHVSRNAKQKIIDEYNAEVKRRNALREQEAQS